MGLTLENPSLACCFSTVIRDCKPKVRSSGDLPKVRSSGDLIRHLFNLKPNEQRRKFNISYALPETAASIVAAAMTVGAAATLLTRITKAQETINRPLKTCEDCSGSGICSECNGEGFVLKKLTEESADKARLSAKNMATRYTAGLPKKWSYCSKCSSSRSCSTCGGRGVVE